MGMLNPVWEGEGNPGLPPQTMFRLGLPYPLHPTSNRSDPGTPKPRLYPNGVPGHAPPPIRKGSLDSPHPPRLPIRVPQTFPLSPLPSVPVWVVARGRTQSPRTRRIPR